MAASRDEWDLTMSDFKPVISIQTESNVDQALDMFAKATTIRPGPR